MKVSPSLMVGPLGEFSDAAHEAPRHAANIGRPYQSHLHARPCGETVKVPSLVSTKKTMLLGFVLAGHLAAFTP